LGKEYRTFSSSLCIFLHYPVIFQLVYEQIIFNTIKKLCTCLIWFSVQTFNDLSL
jgi:hypothetical protein